MEQLLEKAQALVDATQDAVERTTPKTRRAIKDASDALDAAIKAFKRNG